MRATPLRAEEQPLVLSFLEGRQASSVFMLGMLDRRPISVQGDELWWGVWEKTDTLCGVAFTGEVPTSAGRGLWVLAGEPAAGPHLGTALKTLPLPAMCIGPRALVDTTWAHLGGPEPGLATRSRCFYCSEVQTTPDLEVMPARMADLDWLREVSVAMMQEDLGLDPRSQDPQAHEARIRASIISGRSWIGWEAGRPVFRLEVGTQCRHGVQVGGTWVPRSHRGQGIATRGMAAVCTQLLEQSPLVALHVREDNLPAVACYERVGFISGPPLRLLVR